MIKRIVGDAIPTKHKVAILSLLLLVALVPQATAIVWADNFVGTNNADDITGTDENDRIKALGGDDNINGLGGDDRINGGRGDDDIDGGSGSNTVFGGRGEDTITSETEIGDITINAGSDNDNVNAYVIEDGSITIDGRRGNDQINARIAIGSLTAFIKVNGGSGSDDIQTTAEMEIPVTVHAGPGDDTVHTSAGAAFGDKGDDYLEGTGAAGLLGGDGDDTLVARNPDLPHLTGGDGADQFDCGGSEDVSIEDFNASEGDTKINCPEL